MSSPGLKGELAEGVLPGILRTLYVGRRTGLLRVSRGEDEASACFVQGAIVYGSSNIRECQIGATLVRHGFLTQWDVDRVVEMTQATGKRLGDLLQELHLLDRDRLDDALALQVREVLLAIFSWREGSYCFDDEDPATFRGYDHPLKLPMGEVILDAVWSISDPDVIRYGLGDLDRVLAPATDPLLRFQRVTLSAVDGFILSRVDGTLTARQILELAPVEPEEAERSLFGLLHTGMADYAPEAPHTGSEGGAFREQALRLHASLGTKSHHDVLGLSPGASAAEIHAAWVRLARLYHPDAHHQHGLEDLHDHLAAIFARVNEAHRELTRQVSAAAAAAAAATPPAKPAPEPAPAGDAEVERTLELAEQALGSGRPWEAIAVLERVFEGLAGRQRRRARMLRAQARLRGGQSDGRRAAEEELKAAIAEDPANAEAHFLLGTIYRTGGAHALAAAQFRKVLQLKPRHAGALEQLAAPPGSAPETGAGLLKKLFRG